MATTSQRLRQIMAIRDIKQSELIEITGISKGAMSCYLSGKYVPKQDNIYKLAKALDVNPAWLMGLDVPMELFDAYIEEKTFTDEQIAHAMQLYNQFVMATPETQQAIELLLGQTKQIAEALQPVISEIPKIKPHLPKLPQPVAELPHLKKDTDK